MEKRKFIRQPVDLEARISLEGGGQHTCRIKDFSLGGVFVACSSLTDDGPADSESSAVEHQPVELQFSAGSRGTKRKYRIGGRLTRVLKSGIGIEFVDPDPATLLVMQEAANQDRKAFLETRASEAAREKAAAGPGSKETGDRAGIMETLKELVRQFLNEYLEELFKDANERLFNSAKTAPNNVEERACFDAIKEVENIKSLVEQAFLDAMLDHVTHLGDHRLAGPEVPKQFGGELTLVDPERFQDWLRVKRILERAEPKYKDTQYELLARLSAVSDTKIDQYNNPIGLLEICGSFFDSVQELGVSVVARNAVFDALESTMVSDLGMLYDNVNSMFVSQGILPTVEPPKPIIPKNPRTATPPDADQPASPGAPEGPPPQGAHVPQRAYAGTAPSHAGAPPPPGSSTDPAQTGAHAVYPGGAPSAPPPPATAAPAAQPGYPPPGTSRAAGLTSPAPPPGAQSGPAHAPASAASPQPAHGGGAPAGSVGAGASPADTSAQPVAPVSKVRSPGRPQGVTPSPGSGARPTASAYQAVHTLLGLQRQAGSTGVQSASAAPPGTASGAGTPATEAPGPPTYARDEIMHALSGLQHGSSAGGDVPDGIDLKERIRSTLEAQQPSGVSRQLGEAENDAIDLTSGLVESIVDDVLVSAEIRPQLKRLEVPLVKAAMKNKGFFADSNHPARRVVDQLGALNIPKGEAGTKLQQIVDKVVSQITSREGDGSSEFTDAAHQLDAVVKAQMATYEKNVQSVVEDCERQEEIITSRRKDASEADDAGTETRAAMAMTKEWRQWLERARRFRVGDRVLFHKGGRAHQESLAWVRDDQNKYVFVDAAGKKASSMIRQELAMQLKRGLVQVLEEAALPAMERGMHMMMRKMHEKLVYKATQDATTGLLNLKAFQNRVERAISDARQTHSEHLLCHLDLDHFGKINEKWGKTAGDRLLARFGIVLSKNVGDKGFTARLREDEFGLVLERCSLEKGYEIVNRLGRAISSARCYWKGESLPLSVSIGVVSITDRSESVTALMQAAEAVCAKAKEAGRDRVEAFQPEPDEAETGSNVTVTVEDIAKILQGDRLQLICQRLEPIAKNADLKPHYEIQLAIRDEKGKLFSPEAFIRAAERCDQIAQVDRWVIRTALQWMAKNKRRLLKLGGFSINLSGPGLNDDTLTQYVLDQLMETKVPPGKVLFEVTETAAIERLSTAEEFLRTMKDFGCRFSLEDFGSSDSSYEYLRRLPLDYVKIDRMFVKQLETNPNDYAIVKSITEIGHSMGMKTIAEFVENEATLGKLKEIGVDYAQGYGVEKPMLLQKLS